MTITDRMLIGSIANNPANYEGEGEWRYSIPNEALYFSSVKEPDQMDQQPWLPLPALDPDGSRRKERAFKLFIKRRWVPSRQKELEEFARKRGWDLAMELKYGGGALEDNEAEEWQYVINRELERLVQRFRQKLDEESQ
jgi:hypothetical protein